jgi:hypothetical protein
MACSLATASIAEAVYGPNWAATQPAKSSMQLLTQCQQESGFERFRENGASFVTLEKYEQLRGCIGSLTASRALSVDISANAMAACLHDPRFPPLQADELPGLSVSISILSIPVSIDCDSESELAAMLVPGRDGLILQYGTQRATYLPSVWEQLPDATRFVAELKRKAGFAESFWHKELKAHRYFVHYIKCHCAF